MFLQQIVGFPAFPIGFGVLLHSPSNFRGGGGAPRGRSPAPLVGARRVAGDLPEACGEAPGGESGAGWLGDDLCDAFCSWVWFSIVLVLVLITNRTAQGGGGNFKDRTL